MRSDLTELVFILDRSGSMCGLEKDTIGGFNAMLAQQRAENGSCNVTTVLFSDDSRLLHDRIDVRAVRSITAKEYRPGGSTALMDAIGMSIEKIDAVQRSVADEYRAGNVLFVIITDGEENASRHFHPDRIRTMIEERKARFGWKFMFLGANIDAVRTASTFGVDANMAADYLPDSAGTRTNFTNISRAASELRNTGSIGADVLDDVRNDAKKRGGK